MEEFSGSVFSHFMMLHCWVNHNADGCIQAREGGLHHETDHQGTNVNSDIRDI